MILLLLKSKNIGWPREEGSSSKLFALLNSLVVAMGTIAICSAYYECKELYILCKPLTTLLIIAIPLIFGNRHTRNYLKAIVVALLFCLLGDIFLLNAEWFVHGLSAFFIAHVCFLLGFVSLDGFRVNVVPLILLIMIGVGICAFIWHSLDAFVLPVMCYIFIIILMAWQGVNLYLNSKQAIAFWIGLATVLFLISDAILAIDKFRFSFKASSVFILGTYWLSILLLANSTYYVGKDIRDE